MADDDLFDELFNDEDVCSGSAAAGKEDEGKRDRNSSDLDAIFMEIGLGSPVPASVAVMHTATRRKLVEQWRKEDSTFEIVADEKGDYQICFGNRLATNAVKQIVVSIHAGSVDELLEHEVENLADIGHLERLNEMVLRLARRVSDLKEQEEYLRRRSERHHSTAESNNHRVMMSSIAEASVLVAVNLWQIHYLRAFFEVKRII